MTEISTLFGNWLGFIGILEEIALKALLIILVWKLIKNPHRWGFRSSRDKESN